MKHHRHNHIAGFTLTEMAIVLGVVGILVAGLWNLISGANQQARDESAASEQSQLITAVKGFLYSAQGQNYMKNNSIPVASGGCNGNCVTNANFSLPLPGGAACNDFGDANWIAFCTFLPPGFTSATVNSYGQTFQIRILRDPTPNPDATGALQAPNSYSFMVLTKAAAGTVIPDTSGARISALIGGDGGFIYTNPVCSTAANVAVTACGSYGGWSVLTTGISPGFGFAAANSVSGSVASRTYMSPQINALSDWLARVPMPGDSTFSLNTMTTPEYLGGQQLNMGGYGAPTLPLNGGAFNLQGGAINFATPGATTGGGWMDMQNGNIYLGDKSAITTAELGGTIDLMGGQIVSTTNGVNDSIHGAGNDAIVLNAGNGNGNSDITANFPCTVNSYNPNFYSAGSGQGIEELPSVGDTTVGAGTPCNFAITATSITVGGIVYANGFYAGTFIYNASDASLKKNIRPLSDPLEKVEKLNPVSFAFKSNNEPGMGVIAQEVEKVYPQLVAYGEGGKKYVNYDGLIAPLIGAVQELKHENDELRRQLEADEVRQQKLEDQLRQNTAR